MQGLYKKIHNAILAYYWRIYCYQNAIEVYFVNSVKGERLSYLARDFDYLLTAGIQCKLPKQFLMQFKKYAVNFHYSLLPKYRGTFPIFWQKLYGDHAFGYSFHIVTDHMDAGEILLQENLVLNPALSDSSICDLLTKHASYQLHRLFSDALDLRMQDSSLVSSYSFSDYIEFVNISIYSDWYSKWKGSKRWILMQRYVVHTGDILHHCESDGVILKGFKLYICSGGTGIELKRVSYLPAVLYFWPLKKLFAKQ